jgi:hypothetical protein
MIQMNSYTTILAHEGGSDSDKLWDSPLESEIGPIREKPPNCELEARITAALDTCQPDPEWVCAKGEALLVLDSDIIEAGPIHFVLSEGQYCVCVTTSDGSTATTAVPRVC